MNVLLLNETCMVQASVHWFACFSINSCGENPFGCNQYCSPPPGGDTVLFLDWLHLPSLHKVIYTCFKVPTVLTPQVTQLGQQTALQITHLSQTRSSNRGKLSSFIMEPYVTGTSMRTLKCPHTPLKSPPWEIMHSSHVCLPCCWLPGSEGRVSDGLVLPQSLPPAAAYPSWSVTVNKKIQSAAHHTRLSSPLPARMSRRKRDQVEINWTQIESEQ